MSETKPPRPARSQDQSEAAVGNTPAQTPVLPVKPAVAMSAEPVSAIALAQGLTAGPACPVPEPPVVSRPDEPPKPAAADFWTVFVEAQSALARGFERIAVEMTGMSRSGMTATADAAVALLGARTVAEAVEINAGLARRGADSMLQGSARLSEIGASTVAEAYRPILAGLGRS